MVETTLYITLVTFHMCFCIRRILSQGLFTIPHTVGFHISLGYDINTVFVTQIIPQVCIRIVTGTNRIKVVFLHHLDVLQHTFAGNHISAVRIHFMTVCSLKQYRLPVCQDLAVFQFYLTETDFHRDNFQFFIAFFQRSDQGIQVRRFSRPLQRIGNSDIRRHFA